MNASPKKAAPQKQLSRPLGLSRVKLRNTLIAWAFMLPAMIILLIFVFYPIVYSIPLAFTNYSVFAKTEFVGLKNFRRLLADKDFHTALKNSLLFIVVVPILQILSIALAVLMNKKTARHHIVPCAQLSAGRYLHGSGGHYLALYF